VGVEEGGEALAQLVEGVPERMNEGVGADDADRPELVDLSQSSCLVAEILHVFMLDCHLLARTRRLVPGHEQVDGFLSRRWRTERK
jgi:hypothetical protein